MDAIHTAPDVDLDAEESVGIRVSICIARRNPEGLCTLCSHTRRANLAAPAAVVLGMAREPRRFNASRDKAGRTQTMVAIVRFSVWFVPSVVCAVLGTGHGLGRTSALNGRVRQLRTPPWRYGPPWLPASGRHRFRHFCCGTELHVPAGAARIQTLGQRRLPGVPEHGGGMPSSLGHCFTFVENGSVGHARLLLSGPGWPAGLQARWPASKCRKACAPCGVLRPRASRARGLKRPNQSPAGLCWRGRRSRARSARGRSSGP